MATRFNDISFFDGRTFLEAKNNVIRPYDGSNLYNVRPASAVIPFTSSSDSPTVVWDANNPGLVTFTHSMNCYPVVLVYDNNREQVYPTVTILSGNSFSLNFESSTCPVGSNETWLCVVGYGADYGNNGSLNTEIASLIQYLEELAGITEGMTPSSSSSSEEPSSSSAPQLEEATNAQIDGRSPSTTIITPNNLVYAVRSVVAKITSIPSNTTSYNLYDASSTLNNHSGNYVHMPYQNPTYVLPDIAASNTYTPTSDLSSSAGVHEIVVDVSFCGFERDSSDDTGNKYCWCWGNNYVFTETETPVEGETVVYDLYLGSYRQIGTVAFYDSTNNVISLASSCSFEDWQGNEIIPLSTPNIGIGSAVSYLCRWSYATWDWHILPIQLR